MGTATTRMEQGEIGGTSNRHQTVGQALQDPDETKIELERRRKVQVLGTTMGDNGDDRRCGSAELILPLPVRCISSHVVVGTFALAGRHAVAETRSLPRPLSNQLERSSLDPDSSAASSTVPHFLGWGLAVTPVDDRPLKRGRRGTGWTVVTPYQRQQRRSGRRMTLQSISHTLHNHSSTKRSLQESQVAKVTVQNRQDPL